MTDRTQEHPEIGDIVRFFDGPYADRIGCIVSMLDRSGEHTTDGKQAAAVTIKIDEQTWIALVAEELTRTYLN